MATPPEARLGLALRRAREERGLSLRALASRLHRAHSNLHDYEKGNRLPSIEVVEAYEAILDVVPGSLTSVHRRVTDDLENPKGQHSSIASGQPSTGRGQHDDAAPAPAANRRGRAFTVAALAATIATGGAMFVSSLGDTNNGPAFLSVYNIEAKCQAPRTDECRLGLARDPYASYTRENVIGGVWHGDRLSVECFIAEGAQVAAEDRTMSQRWYRVSMPQESPAASPGAKAWLPGIRVRSGTEPAVRRCEKTP